MHAESALAFYHQRKGPEPTQRCVVGGQSCSQRFEEALKAAKEEGKTAAGAVLYAFKQTVAVCAEINETSRVVAGVILFTGTTKVISGISLPLGIGKCAEAVAKAALSFPLGPCGDLDASSCSTGTTDPCSGDPYQSY